MICERYQIERELGRGACGITYLANDLATGRKVALKQLVIPHTLQGAERVDHIQRFLREARSASAIRHPGVPEIYEVGAAGDEYFIAMEFCPGQTLRKLLADRGSVPIEQSLRITKQVLEVLEQAHARGIYHRDIKPDNLMLSPDEQRVQVMDFGIARTAGDITLTRTGASIGTPSYMSPEQAAGERVDGRSDLFSVAILLHELITGTRPFAGSTLPQLLHAIVYGEPAIAPDLPKPVAEILRIGLAKDPKDRFADAGEMRAALEAVEDSGGLPRGPQPGPPVIPASAPFGPHTPAGTPDPFGPLPPTGVAVPIRVSAPLQSPAAAGAPTQLMNPGTMLGTGNDAWARVQDLWGRPEVRQFGVAAGAFLVAAVLLVVVYNRQQDAAASGRPASVRLPPYRPHPALNPPTGRPGSQMAGGFGQLPGATAYPYSGGGMSAAPTLPPAAPHYPARSETGSWGQPIRSARKPKSFGLEQSGPGGTSTRFRMNDDSPLPKLTPLPKGAAAMASARAVRPENGVPAPFTASPELPAGESEGARSAQSPTRSMLPTTETPATTNPLPATAPLPSPGNATPVRVPQPTSRTGARSGSFVRGGRRDRVRGGDRYVYTIPAEHALNYGIRTTQRIPDPGRYGFWYQTLSPREAWEQHRIRVMFPIPAPEVYGLPPVPLRKLPPPPDYGD